MYNAHCWPQVKKGNSPCVTQIQAIALPGVRVYPGIDLVLVAVITCLLVATTSSHLSSSVNARWGSLAPPYHNFN